MKRTVQSALVASAILGSASFPASAAETIRMAFIDPLSGPFAANGSNGLKEFKFMAAQINAEGGILGKQLEIVGFDNKISPKESLIQLKRVIAEGMQYVFQGNSSGVANALTDAIDKHNKRNPDKRVLFMNYSAVDPALTNKKCNFWHFRFDANADMKMNALTDVIAKSAEMKKIYIIGQDYSFGKAVASAAVKMLAKKRPDMEVVGNELHPIGKVKDFAPYVAKIKASGAQAIITGNWGVDMIGLAKAVGDAGLDMPIYTYYAAKSGVTKAIGKGGVDKVRLVGEGTDNPPLTDAWRDYMTRYKAKHPDSDITQPRITNALAMIAKAIEKAGTTAPIKVAAAMEGMKHTAIWGDEIMMRASDHQMQLPIRISVHTDQNIEFDADNSGFGLVNESTISMESSSLPTTCKMKRPT